MSVHCTDGFCTEDELAELRCCLLSRYNIDSDRVSSDPKDRYIQPLVASEIPCVKRIVEKALAYVISKTSESNLCFINTKGAVALITAAYGVERHQSWHRDTRFKGYTVCIPLVHVTENNGCTEILMKSTRTTVSRWRRHIKRSKKVTCTAGSIYIFNSQLLHRGRLNTTRQTRPVLCLHITPPAKLFYSDDTNWEST